GSFALASAIGASGLIAVAVTGLFYGNTVLLNIESKKVGDVTREFWSIIAFVANAAAFFFIGVSTNIFLLATSVGAFVVAYGVVVMARITSVYPILSIMKVEGRETASSWMNVSTLGGMRGALAIALVSAVPLAARQPVATLTFGVVMLSILLQGPLLERYANRVFGHQETLQSGEADEAPPARGPAQTSAEPLSPEPEERDDDELR
ncbi:MAG: cation:proton antiporter, partial [Nitrososphaerota archaeon]|nr:cation:proton antiporter [Nitrososphaerota archaeon]